MEDQLKKIVGELIFQIASLQKQNEDMRASLIAKENELLAYRPSQSDMNGEFNTMINQMERKE